MPRIIELYPHNPAWSEKYETEALRIAQIVGDELVSIHHIGSTAIPGIKAKPIIDIMVVVEDIDKVEGFNPGMVQLGYTPRGEMGIPGRRYFRRDTEGVRSHHVHIYAQGHPAIKRQLDFRDYLKAHSERAKAYSRLKETLALKFREDPHNYTEGKTDFIEETILLAADWREQIKPNK